MHGRCLLSCIVPLPLGWLRPRTWAQAYLKLSRTASTEESMRLLDSIGAESGKPSWASAQGYHPDDGDEFGHLVDEIEDEEL